jgi:hypothetical protein
VNDNEWRHIAWTLDPNGEWKIYVNGALIHTVTKVYPNAVQRTLNYIGKSHWTDQPYYNGAIDDFRYYTRVLTSSEVTDIYTIPFKSTIYFSSLQLQNNYFSCIDTCASTLAGINKDSATPVGSCYYPSSVERAEGNSLCGFKQAITNWPLLVGASITTGWDCSSGATALTYPCSSTGLYLLLLANPPEASRSYSSILLLPDYKSSMLDSSVGQGCWAAANPLDTNQHMTIDLGSIQYVAGVVTQARCKSLSPSTPSQYVTQYYVGYSTDGISFTYATSATSSQTFYGPQSDSSQPSCNLEEKVYQYFSSLINTQYIRFYPQVWEGYLSMRAGVLVSILSPPFWSGVVCNGLSVTRLILRYKGLQGKLSSSISLLSSLSQLALLHLDNNEFSGQIPSSISLLSRATLASLQLSSNRLTGKIPLGISSLSHMKSMFLHDNQLTGPVGKVPFCYMPLLATLTLQENKFSCIETCAHAIAIWNKDNIPIGDSCMLPTSQPSAQPSFQPSALPSIPSSQPSALPSAPSSQPSSLPTNPTSQPSSRPSFPSSTPSRQPTSQPSRQPSSQPSRQPSAQPSVLPSKPSNPSTQPTSRPSFPSSQPSSQPSMQPTALPSRQPSMQPSSQPSRQPSRQPSTQPSRQPTMQPSIQPFSLPSSQPSCQPTRQPLTQPSSCPSRPSSQPSTKPSIQPSCQPSAIPSSPTCQPSSQPSIAPTNQPSLYPSNPSSQPSALPSTPSSQPSAFPSTPSMQPSRQPSMQPSRTPSSQPTNQPIRRPSSLPTLQPFIVPSCQPTRFPSSQPSLQPFSRPSSQPSTQPSLQPTRQPSMQPSKPSSKPSRQPSRQPSRKPSSQPSRQPFRTPSTQPSRLPTSQPSIQPSTHPSSQPSRQPTMQPSSQPTSQPSVNRIFLLLCISDVSLPLSPSLRTSIWNWISFSMDLYGHYRYIICCLLFIAYYLLFIIYYT